MPRVSRRGRRDPVPIWIGCGTDSRAVARVGRLADGWLPEPTVQPGRGFEPAWLEVRAAATSAGRDPDALGLEGQLWVTTGAGESAPRPTCPMA